MKAKWSRIFLGVGMIAAAIFLVMDQLHLLPIALGFWSIFWTIVFGTSLITSLFNKNLYGTIFSIAFLLIVYAKPLHIQALAPWTILLVAVLVSLGISLIFKKSFKPTVIINGEKINTNWSDLKHHKSFETDQVISDTNFGVSGDNVVISESMSNASRYIHSQSLQTITVNVSMSDVNIYLDDAKAAGDEVIVNVDASMSDINIYLPDNWQIDSRLEHGFGDIEMDYKGDTGTRLVLQGKLSFGDLKFKHIQKN